jgi:7,8-dihydropterin-6-yl-methyl-4-(beta-D-ribofuranosyl)aminobenzene 5'-phosphate synthase
MKLLAVLHGTTVFIDDSFPSGFKRAVKKRGPTVIEAGQPLVVSTDCLSTGKMASWVKNEQALIILTSEGAIIITGCAHPGVVEIVEYVQKITKRNVLLMAGGFHLLMDDVASIRKKAARLKQLGVRYVAPSHCTGGQAMKIFAEAYGDRFIDSGVGRIIAAGDLA